MDSNELNQRLDQLYSSAQAASQEGLTDEAIKHCETALDLLEISIYEETEYSTGDFLMLAGEACWEDGDLSGAGRYFLRTLEAEPNRLDALVAVGVTCFHLTRLGAARHYLEIATIEDPECGEAWYYLALLARRRGQNNLAMQYFERAFDAEPERWPMPVFLTPERIEEILKGILDNFPEELLAEMSDIPLVLESRPSEDFLNAIDPPLDPLVLTALDGPTKKDKELGLADEASQIYIFVENISLIASAEEKMLDGLASSLVSEVGYYIGLDEDDLAARGLI